MLNNGVVEIKCRSLDCKGGRKDVVVIHLFDAITGQLIETRRYKDAVRKEQ